MSESKSVCPTELPAFCQQRHWSIYWILIACSLAMICGRITTVRNFRSAEPTPIFSANDRSRWSAIHSLVDYNQWHIDDAIASDGPLNWDTIDKVQHVGSDGEMHSYSSKPPLHTVMVAAAYSALKLATGWTIDSQPFAVVRTLLLVFNGGCWFLLLVFLAKTIDCISVRDWSRYFILACAGFGTLLGSFAITLNNHLPAAAFTMVAVYSISKIMRPRTTRLPQATTSTFLWAGLSAALAATFEMPALLMLVILGLLCLLRSPTRTLLAFVPPVILVAACFFAANWYCHGDWKIPYAHRNDGQIMATVELSEAERDDVMSQLDRGQLPPFLNARLAESALQSPTDSWSSFLVRKDNVPKGRELAFSVHPGDWAVPVGVRRWVLKEKSSPLQFAIRFDRYGFLDALDTEDSAEPVMSVHRWSNWYEYPGSYWLASARADRSLVDQGQPDRFVYLFHCLIGHHGIFSLTPFWILAFAGLLALPFAGRYQLRWLGLVAMVISIVVLTFYVTRPAIDRNYGGVSSGLRWMFWLIPMWLVAMLPVVDWLGQSRWGRALCLVLLVAGVLSASYGATRPWVHPWLYEVWSTTGLPM